MKQWNQSVLGCMTAGLLMMTSFPVFAADSSSDPSGKSQPVTEGSTFDDGTLTYTILKNMQVSVTGCITTATNISIMPKIDGYTVVSIGDQAFAGCRRIRSGVVDVWRNGAVHNPLYGTGAGNRRHERYDEAKPVGGRVGIGVYAGEI